MSRGRPAGQMTQRRQQVLAAYSEAMKRGEPIRLARLARECGLHDRQKLNRVLRDLRGMGALPAGA